MERVGAPSASKNLDIVYTVRFWNESSKITTTHLEFYDIQTGQSKQLTYSEGHSDFSPLFTSDGSHVYFLSDRSGSVQIWEVATQGGEPTQVTNLPIDIDYFELSPKDNFFLFAAQVYPDCATLQCTADRDAEIAARGPNTGFVYNSLFVRHWDRWETGKQSHLFILSTSTDSTGRLIVSQSEPVDIMSGMNATTPVYPDGGAEQFAISPAGDEIAFTTSIIDHSTAWTTGWKTYTVSVAGGNVGTPYCITSYTEARTTNPVYSPNGAYIAYLAMDRPGFEADRFHIMLYERSSQTNKKIANSWDRSVNTLQFSRDGSVLFADADDDGSHKLFGVTIATGSVTTLIGTGNNGGVAVVPGTDLVVLNRDSMNFPVDIWAFNFSQNVLSNLTQLTYHNLDILNSVQMSQPESFYFSSVNNSKVQGWFLKPYGWESGKSYPAAFLIHGGPQGAWLDNWSYRWNPQLWAAHGYAVIAINPHGSTGFGQAFTDAVSKNWGGVPYMDLLNGLSYILSKNPWIQADNVCACGASYGGYMINWINGHTNKFKCLVVHDGVFETLGGYFSTDELWFEEWEFGGVPWVDSSIYNKWNPLNSAGSMKTPTLVIHGGKDFRLPVTHGLSMFTALQRQGVPSRFLYFPEENHWVLNPPNGIMWYDNVLSWLDEWTGNSIPKDLHDIAIIN